jgi:hypothetical protein
MFVRFAVAHSFDSDENFVRRAVAGNERRRCSSDLIGTRLLRMSDVQTLCELVTDRHQNILHA